MWVDPNLNDFYSRVSRIEKSHAKGYGFEAKGTVGRKAGSRTGSRVMRLLKPLALALVLGEAEGLVRDRNRRAVWDNAVLEELQLSCKRIELIIVTLAEFGAVINSNVLAAFNDLAGVDGSNRARGLVTKQIAANNDLQAIQAWLAEDDVGAIG